MKKIFQSVTILALVASMTMSCQKDDTDFSNYDFDNYALRSQNGDEDDDTSAETINTIYIVYSGSSVTVMGDSNGYVSSDGADVTVDTGTDTDSLLLVLSGTSTDGSLIVYREKKYGVMLNGLTLHNSDGPAINNQCGKSLYIEVAAGTTNSLTDGTAYDETVGYQQKGTLFSEGQVYFLGSGSLTVEGHCKNAIASDDYVVISEDVQLNVTSTASNGIKVNEGFYIDGGTVEISVTADGARGIKCDSVVVVSGGSMTITTAGDCKIESTDGVADTTSAACIKSSCQFMMTGGSVTLTSSGDGGKGINCDEDVVVSGGTLEVTTTGSSTLGKPKGVKGVTGITVSGGSFTATVAKSWACDNGTDSEDPADRVTIVGTPTTQTLAKKSVVIVF